MKIYVVGIGPGDPMFLTPQARQAIADSEVIVGYKLYIDLLGDLSDGKELVASSMKRETERCKIAVETALKGKTVAVVCSGDAGVYGMAGLVLEIAEPHPDLDIEIIPGVTAAISAAAVLGSPLTNDFAVVSLSDLLTPWEVIEKRLSSASAGDFVTCLYNPGSKTRTDYLSRACEIILQHKPAETACGLVQNIGREGESSKICTLAELQNFPVDMFTLVIIGNSQTKVINNRLVTQRGYKNV